MEERREKMKPELLLAAANKDNTIEEKLLSWFGRVLGQDIIDAFNQQYMSTSIKDIDLWETIKKGADDE